MVNSKLSSARLGRIGGSLGGYVERGEVAGAVALVARSDEVHCEAVGAADTATGTPMRRDTIFRIASMTKPVTAVAAMMLVEETRLRLDDAVDEWLPELANRRVLRRLDGAVTETVPANRAITLRDLLTFRWGLGAVMAPPGTYPVQQLISEAGVGPGPDPLTLPAAEFMARVAAVPLLHQPGEQWTYHTGSEVLGILIERVTGLRLGDFMKQRIFAPLGMKDTAYWVPEDKMDRYATCYGRDGDGGLAVYDTARGGLWSRPPVLDSGGGGLVSTADDFRLFGRMLLNLGRHEKQRLLARPTVELMTADQLTPQQKAASPFFPGFWETHGWGFGVAVITQPDGIALSPGSYGWDGWDGGFGTTWRNDPREDMTSILSIQRMMTSPNDMQINGDFLTLAYQALDD